MFMPSMLNMADVMADSGYTEEAVFDCGISGQIVFLVVVPMLGSCRVPIEALAHFVAGADDYTAEGMPEHWSGSLSGKWTIKRDRLRILGSSWNIFSDDCAKLAEAWAAATPTPSIDDGFDVPLAEQYKLNARLSIATGRCTLHEAAEIFSIEAGEHNEVILSKLEAAARSGLLPVFDPGRNMRREYGDSTRVRVFDVEVFCDDLNKWLDANEPRVSYRFPVLAPLTGAPSFIVQRHTQGDASFSATAQRQATRYQMCIDAGLPMPADDYSHLPRGIGKIAKGLGITRQSLSDDLKAYINRLKASAA